MALFVILTTVSLLLASSNAAPQNGVDIKIPDACKESGFCSVKPEGYDEIERKFQELLPPFIPNVDDRSSGDTYTPTSEDDDDNCPSTSSWESVYYYKESGQTKLDIIVQTKAFPQKFQRVKCKSTHKTDGSEFSGVGGKCFTKLGLDVFEKEFTCREYLATRSLIVYDPETHSLKPKTYQIPVSCSCHVQD